MSQVSIADQIKLMKSMTVRTGAIHEAQVLQLKRWPTFIAGWISSTVKIDQENKLVIFVCEASSLRPTKKEAAVYKAICQWTRELLWNETKVIIEINSKTVFNSDNL